MRDSTHQMKIWFPVITGGSGTDVFTRRLASALERRNIATEVTWFPRHYEFLPHLLRATPVPPGTTVIHANSWNGFAFAGHGIPLVVTEHQGGYAMDRPYSTAAQKLYHRTFVRRYVGRSLRAATAVTAVSRFVRTGLTKLIDRVDTETIYNCVDTDRFTPAGAVGTNKRAPLRILFMGNPTWMKGADILSEMMRALGNTATLYYTSGLKDRPLADSPQNTVSLGRLANDDEIIRAYHHCDAVIVPSRFEGFGLVALEAMACAKPVIASLNSGIPEVVKDGVTGILCPTGDVASFVAACKLLAQSTEKRIALGLAGRHRAEEMFSESKVIGQYMALYTRLQERRARK